MRSFLMKVTPRFVKNFAKQMIRVYRTLTQRWEGLPSNFIGSHHVDLSRVEFVHQSLFPENVGPLTWLDRPESEELILDKVKNGQLTGSEADECRFYRDQGYFIARGLIDKSFVDSVFDEYLRAWRDGAIVPVPGDRRYLNPHLKLQLSDRLLRHPKIVAYANRFLGVRANPFQSIGSEFGSGQLEHSDAIHMSTYPLGYLIAAWVACEDIHPDSGPLVYYPGSHKLPYELSRAAGIDQKDFRERGYTVYGEKYEPFVQRRIRELSLRPAYFAAKAGDVLFWHHNLLHGGSPIKEKTLTRKSMVFHYFGEGAFCYHDLSGARANFSKPEYAV